MRGNQLILKFAPLVMEAFITLILNDHVVHDHTSSHHLAHHLCAPCHDRVPNLLFFSFVGLRVIFTKIDHTR
jgi:hypothetical protein